MPQYIYTAAFVIVCIKSFNMFLKGFLFRSQKKITDKAKEGLWCVMSLQLSKEFREKSAVKRNKTISRTFIESVVNPVTKMDLFIFTGELKSAMTSGLEITRALTMMSEQTRKPIIKDIIKGILFKINQGIRISEAFSSYPWFFNGIYISSIKIGEENGRIPQVLENLEKALAKQMEIDRKVMGAMIYPVIAFIICIIFTLITFKYIMPGIMEFMSGLEVELPLPTKIVLNLTNIASHPYFSLFFTAFLAVVCYGAYRYISRPTGKWVVDNLALRLPIMCKVVRKLAYVNICRNMATLIDAGIPITNALKLAGGSCANLVFSKSCLDAAKAIENGSNLSEFFLSDPFLYDSVFSSMFMIGEESGRIPNIASSLADMYETDLENFFNSFSSIIEPLMITFVGGIIGFIIASVFLPLYSVLSDF